MSVADGRAGRPAKSLARRLMAALLGIALVSGSAPAFADTSAAAVQRSMETLLVQARRRLAEGRYDEAASLVTAATLLLNVLRECDRTEGRAEARPARWSAASVVERDLSTRL